MNRPWDRWAAGCGAIGWRLVLLLGIGGPVLWAVGYAMLYSIGGVGRLSAGWTTEHWRRAIGEPLIIDSLIYSLAITSVVMVVVVALTFGLLLVWPPIRRSPPFLWGTVVMLATPGLVLSQIVLNTLGPGGWFSRLAHQTRIIDSPSDFPAFTHDRMSVGLVMGIVLVLLPLSMLYFTQVWDTARIDRCCLLAQSLGASTVQARLRVALPVLWYHGRSMLIFLSILAIGSYEIPLLLGRQSPQMFSVATQRIATSFDLMSKPQAYVLATIYFTCTTSMLVVYLWGRRRNV